jgi:hypothetical protein
MDTKKSSSIWGKRRSRLRDPDMVIGEARESVQWLDDRTPAKHSTLSELREAFITPARSYFSLAALSRRKELSPSNRQQALDGLYRMRSLLEDRILKELLFNANDLPVFAEATKNSFFGRSKKQGVSIRYALASCVPTAKCGGLCYAHDGRDRELLHIYRGVLNYFLGSEYESSGEDRRREILSGLKKPIKAAVKATMIDCDQAMESGYKRLPRIRFSHVGEMAATPDFTNAIARSVREEEPSIQCVVYTRHPQATALNTDLLVVNFTTESASDSRIKFCPAGARIVNSAWDGVVSPEAEVNFLEHHVEKGSRSLGKGTVCPVTANHKQMPSCDTARCQKCFVQPGNGKIMQ